MLLLFSKTVANYHRLRKAYCGQDLIPAVSVKPHDDDHWFRLANVRTPLVAK